MMRTPSNVIPRTLLAVSVVCLLIGLRFVAMSARADQHGTVRDQRTLMGTIWTIEVLDHGRSEAAREAINAAYRELHRIDALMSEWKPDSPISQVNAHAGEGAVEVPAELREMLERSVRYSEKSEGTFDITWRGMGRIWHFDDRFRVPGANEVEAARQNVNYREIEIQGNRVRLPRSTMSIGLGGIAKGYAVDRAAQVLKAAGFTDAMVDGGGDVLVSGTKNGEPWRLGVQHPRQERGTLIGVLRLSNQALVTSGDYERFRVVDGVRYHHIIDPRTGWPAKASSSVTVVSPTAERGVVLAKAVFILGPEKGLALARSEGVEVLLIDAQGKRFMTGGFARAFEQN
jgi:thiamine biosynthesis lipoprotein